MTKSQWPDMYVVTAGTVRLQPHDKPLRCPHDDCDTGLRIVLRYPFAVLWCPCGHAWSPHGMTYDQMRAVTADVAAVPRHSWTGRAVPAQLLLQYPGLDQIVRNMGEIVYASRLRSMEMADNLHHELDLGSGPDRWEAARRAIVAFHADPPPHHDVPDDEIVWVPVSARERTLLRELTHIPGNSATSPDQMLVREFADDLGQRARATLLDPRRDARSIVDEHHRAADLVARLAPWLHDHDGRPIEALPHIRSALGLWDAVSTIDAARDGDDLWSAALDRVRWMYLPAWEDHDREAGHGVQDVHEAAEVGLTMAVALYLIVCLRHVQIGDITEADVREFAGPRDEHGLHPHDVAQRWDRAVTQCAIEPDSSPGNRWRYLRTSAAEPRSPDKVVDESVVGSPEPFTGPRVCRALDRSHLWATRWESMPPTQPLPHSVPAPSPR